MNKNYLLLITCLGLVVITIVSSYFSADKKRSEIVFAQNPYEVVGCFNHFESTIHFCGCEGDGDIPGTIESEDYAVGSGTKGADIERTTCEAGNSTSCSASM